MELAVDLCEVVNELAHVQAQIANLEALEKNLKKELIDSMQSCIEGDLHKAVVRYVEPAASPDYKACVEFLCVSQEVINRFMKKAPKPYSSVTLYGK